MTAYMDHKDLTNESIDETRATQIRDGVHRVLDAIAEAESAAGRAPGSVKLLAATKTRDVGEIMAAIDAGIRMIGENRPQEVMAKAEGLRRLCADRGFALGTGDGDTLDRLTPNTSRSISSASCRPTRSVKSSPTSTPSNRWTASNWRSASPAVPSPVESRSACFWKSTSPGRHRNRVATRRLPSTSPHRSRSWTGIRLEGLMTIGAHVDDEATIRACFAHLRGTRDTILASRAPAPSTARNCRWA